MSCLLFSLVALLKVADVTDLLKSALDDMIGGQTHQDSAGLMHGTILSSRTPPASHGAYGALRKTGVGFPLYCMSQRFSTRERSSKATVLTHSIFVHHKPQ